MNDLRKAAEMALGVLLDSKTRADEVAEAVKVIRQALDLQTAIKKGTKAWADVPGATEWVEELRGNDTPEVTPEVPCKTHPDAPHGFNRNASFDEDRYVCDCEFWEPEVTGETVTWSKIDDPNKWEVQEPYGYFRYDMRLDAWVQSREDTKGIAFYTAPPKKEWVGLTDEEIKKIAKKHKWHEGNVEPHLMPVFRSLEAKLKEKNGG